MASNPSSNLPEFIDNTWTNQSPGDRLRSIEQIQQRGNAAQAALLHIARNDEHAQVRCGAVRYLSDITALSELQQADAEVAEAAQQQYHRILAGAFDTDLSDKERLHLIGSAPLAAAKQIALLAKSKAAGTAALERIIQAEDLADLCLFAASVHVRKQAAMKIEDSKLLKELYEKVRDKDKTVSKVLAERLDILKTDKPAVKNSEVEMATGQGDVAETVTAQTSVTDTATPPVTTDAASPTTTPAHKKPRKAKPDIAKPAPDPVTELPQIEQQLAKSSHKHTQSLNSLRNTLNKLRKAVPADNAELTALATTLHTQLTEKLEKNHAHQEHLQELTVELLAQLKKALDEGQSHDALPTWDKIQGNISNTSGKIRAALQKEANQYKAKLNELRDWKAFAATEKKKELITQMQHLAESKMHAADRSRHISKMHQEWKALGRSNQNEQLWREFKKLSDKAYEPCKEYFKQRKQIMAANLVKRREICDRLEAEIAKLESEDALNIAQMNKMLNEADREWKSHAPIEQSKIKSMQKRYYAAINQLRKTRKQSLRGNGAQKLEYIAQANALAEHEDNQHAMREAKRLQQEWKKIGPTTFKEDKKYWEDFRAACDKIFARRNQEDHAQRESLKQVESSLADLLRALEALLALDDEAFRAARGEYQALSQQFTHAIDPKQRHQVKRVQEQFNAVKRKLDARYKALPDKKQLQIKNSVREKARFLQEIESQLLACQDAAQFAEIRNAIDTGAWDAIGNSGEARYDAALEARLKRLQKATSPESLRSLADECAEQARALCIELEIRANIDTPREDQDLRMQIQLDQLKNAFGKQKPDPKENNVFALDMELQSYCLGPLEAKLQQQLTQRLEGAIKKLL